MESSSGEEQQILDEFHRLEKRCLAFENYEDNEDKHYLAVLQGLQKLVARIQRANLFSDNEEIKEIATDHLR